MRAKKIQLVKEKRIKGPVESFDMGIWDNTNATGINR